MSLTTHVVQNLQRSKIYKSFSLSFKIIRASIYVNNISFASYILAYNFVNKILSARCANKIELGMPSLLNYLH
jgi:hypothetical protein